LAAELVTEGGLDVDAAAAAARAYLERNGVAELDERAPADCGRFRHSFGAVYGADVMVCTRCGREQVSA
jgi:hypothetical protein